MADGLLRIPGIAVPPGFHPNRMGGALFVPDEVVNPAGLPMNLGGLQYTLFAQPLLPQGNSSIDPTSLEYNLFSMPIVAKTAEVQYKIAFVSGVPFGSIVKVSATDRSAIAKISGAPVV